jgi:hypothetical protein
MNKNWKKFTAEKKILFWIKKNSIYLSLGLHKGRPSYRRSLQLKREHPALQNMKFLDYFLLLWVIFALLDPDPDQLALLNQDPIRIRIRNTSSIQDYRARDDPRGSAGPSGGRGTLIHSPARTSSRVGQVKTSQTLPGSVFGPPGSGSSNTRSGFGSGSFYHLVKIVRKTLIPTIL